MMDGIIKDLKPSNEIIKIAKEKQQEHFNLVNKNYPNLEY